MNSSFENLYQVFQLQNLEKMALVKGPKIALILIIAFFANQLVGRTLKRFLRRAFKIKERVGRKDLGREKTLRKFILSVSRSFIWIVALLMILTEFGVNTSALLAGIGVLSLAIAMGSQQAVADCVNGFFIIMDDQYRVGDEVEISGKQGRVDNIDLRRTILKDNKGNIHHIPHSKVSITSRKENGPNRRSKK
jgi:small-conductance mechanosensitive channel